MSEFTDCNGHTDSFPDYIPSQLIKGKRMEGSENKGKKALEPVTRPEGNKKGTARGGRRQILGDGVVVKTNMWHLQPRDNSDDVCTHNTSTKIPEKDTGGAEGGSKENVEGTGCTHFKTVWGLRLDVLLLTIVIGFAAVILKLPPGAQQVALENPAIQQQLRDLAVSFNERYNEVISTMKNLKFEVNKNSEKNIEQSTKLHNMHNGIIKINDILLSEVQTKVTEIIDDIAVVKNDHYVLSNAVDSIQSDRVDVKDKQEQSDSNLSRDKRNIRKTVTDTSDANSALSDYVSHVEKELNDHKSNFDTTTSNEEMKKANDMVLEVRKIAKTATEMVDLTNAKLKIMEQHLINKDALRAAFLILLVLIIGLMLYVLKLKSSFQTSIAGESTSRSLEVK